MAKLLGARVAWAAADNALQIHGGNGFALEYEISPRVLCDARILNIFEGAARSRPRSSRAVSSTEATPEGLHLRLTQIEEPRQAARHSS